MDKIGKAIKKRRKLLGLSQKQLAAIADVGINTLTKIERGEANPALNTLGKVLESLGLEICIHVKSIGE